MWVCVRSRGFGVNYDLTVDLWWVYSQEGSYSWCITGKAWVDLTPGCRLRRLASEYILLSRVQLCGIGYENDLKSDSDGWRIIQTFTCVWHLWYATSSQGRVQAWLLFTVCCTLCITACVGSQQDLYILTLNQCNVGKYFGICAHLSLLLNDFSQIKQVPYTGQRSRSQPLSDHYFHHTEGTFLKTYHRKEYCFSIRWIIYLAFTC